LTLLSNEKQEVLRIQLRLRDKMIEAVEKGVGLFRGVSREAQALGKSAGEIFKSFFEVAFPDLYPKLELGSRAVTGKEADEILKAANLSGLSPVFYDGDNGLALVVQQGSQWVANESAAVAKEILDYIKREHAYGNKVTGKILEEHFSGLGYGWEKEIVKLVLAVLLRAGSVEVTHQGRRLRNYQDPPARAAFASVPSFRSASFSPRESVGLKTLTTAVQHLEELTGEEVDIEEGAIAARFRKLADEEMKLLLPLAATVLANRLPGSDFVEEYRQALTGIQGSASDDCVRILAGEGTSFKENRDAIRQMREAVDSGAAQMITNARLALEEEWPVLQRQGIDLIGAVNELKSFLEPDRFYENIAAVKKIARDISEKYRDSYARLHEERSTQFASAIDDLKGRAKWALVPEDVRAAVLSPLTERACELYFSEENSTRCAICRSTVSEMQSDLVALDGIKAQAIARIQELTAPPEEEGVRSERVKLAEFFTDTLDSQEAIEEAIQRLRDYLLKLTSENVRIIVE